MLNRRQLLAAAGATALSATLEVEAKPRYGIAGKIFTEGTVPVAGARVMLLAPNGTLLREARSNRTGNYQLLRVDSGLHRLAVAAPGLQYRELLVSSGSGVTFQDFGLLPESAAGEWSTGGVLDPLTGTGPLSGVLLPDGRVFLAGDGILIFDPTTGESIVGAPSPVTQIGHAAALLADGRVLLVGGGAPGEGGVPLPTATVSAYQPADDTWEVWPGIAEPRWSPTLARLTDGRLLVIGGLGAAGAPLSSCEILDPATGGSVPVASLPVNMGRTPALPLADGRVLCTWDVPRIYDPRQDEWLEAPGFAQPERADLEGCPAGRTPPAGELPHPGDLPDHLLAPLPDGTAVAIGVRRTASPTDLAMAEVRDIREGTWTPQGAPRTPRSMPLGVPLPDGRVLVAGGRQEDPDTAEDVDDWCRVPRVDLFGPAPGDWRRVDDLAAARGNHGVALLLPDARVLVAGGSGDPNSPTGPGSTGIELFTPPYLSRGPRPQILTLSTAALRRGKTLTIDLGPGMSLTDVVLVSARACSRWSDSGAQRTVRLRFNQKAARVRLTVPRSATELPPGHYLLFAMVDDVPSNGKLVFVPEAGRTGR